MDSTNTSDQWIWHDVTTHFDWRDRLRILFGRRVTTTSRIYVDCEVKCVGSSATTHVDHIITRKPKTMGYAEVPCEQPAP